MEKIANMLSIIHWYLNHVCSFNHSELEDLSWGTYSSVSERNYSLCFEIVSTNSEAYDSFEVSFTVFVSPFKFIFSIFKHLFNPSYIISSELE